MDFIHILHNSIAEICPINGVSIGKETDKKTWKIDFKEEATQAQRQAAQQVIDNFDIQAVEQLLQRREKYAILAPLKAIKSEAVDAGDNEVAQEVQKEIDRITNQ